MDQTHGPARTSGARLLLVGAATTLVLGAAAAAVGGLVDGGAAALGVLVGAGLVLVVCVGGTLLVHAVAGTVPGASLLVALLTYTLQVLVLLVAFVWLERSGLVGPTLHRGWLGGAVVGATVTWLGTLVTLSLRARIPAWDLPARGPEAGAR